MNTCSAGSREKRPTYMTVRCVWGRIEPEWSDENPGTFVIAGDREHPRGIGFTLSVA